MLKAIIYKDHMGKYCWHLRAGNNRIVADSGESFSRLSGAVRSAKNYTPIGAEIWHGKQKLERIVCSVMLLLISVSTFGAPITGFQSSINWTGFDNNTYVPFTSSGTLKQEYVDAIVARAYPRVGRDMDWKQLVTNNEVNWSDQPANDFGPNGIREATAINAAKQMRARIPNFVPQVGMPLMSTDAYAFEQGKLWAQQYGGAVEINLGNEVWNVGAGNLGQWNLQQARAEGYQGDDFRVLGLRQGKRLSEHSVAFRNGFAAGGGDPNKVTTIIEGFAPITQYVQNQIDGMTVSPKQLNARISIAQYAAGSATDLQGPLGTAAEKEQALKNFIINSLVPWTVSHRNLAVANQLAPVVDAYEFRLGQKPVSSAAEMNDWINFQLTDNEARVQDFGFRALVEASGGVGANLNIEGYYGFPWEVNQGQFPLIDNNQQMFDNPNLSGAYRGFAGVIDVPEPGVLPCLSLLLALFLARRSSSR